jgi:histidine ammonia-lyase
VTVTIRSRDDVNLKTFERVAFGGEGVTIAPGARKAMQKMHDRYQKYVEANQDTFIYGVTAGGGPDAKKRFSLDQARQRQSRRMPWKGLSFGGPALPEYVSRGTVLTTLTMMVEGHTATHPERADAIAKLLDARKLPDLPSRGLTAAGELMPNFILFNAVPRSRNGGGFSAGSGNGSQTSSAMAAVCAVLSRRRLGLAEKVLALSIEAFNAPLEAYDPDLKAMWDDEHESRALDNLNALLRGAGKPRRFYQAPVSYRIIPRVLGQAHRALAGLEEVAEISLRAVASNPTYILPSKKHPLGKTISTGGYHNALSAPAIDWMAASWVDLASLMQRHIVKMHKGEVSLLPDRLLPEGTDYTSGYSTTYVEYVVNDFLEEMRRLAQPTFLGANEVAASEQDDVPIPTPLAFTMERQVAQCFDNTLAVLAAVASQALHATNRPAQPPLRRLLDEIRTLFPPIESSREIGNELQTLTNTISHSIESGSGRLAA